MIKTELGEEDISSISELEVKKTRRYTGITIVTIALLVALAGYFLANRPSSKTTIGPSSIILSNTKPLPLTSSYNNNINPNSSTQSSTAQSTSNSSNLGSPSYNLQDNVPTGKANQPTGSSIQSASGYQNSTSP